MHSLHIVEANFDLTQIDLILSIMPIREFFQTCFSLYLFIKEKLQYSGSSHEVSVHHYIIIFKLGYMVKKTAGPNVKPSNPCGCTKKNYIQTKVQIFFLVFYLDAEACQASSKNLSSKFKPRKSNKRATFDPIITQNQFKLNR